MSKPFTLKGKKILKAPANRDIRELYIILALLTVITNWFSREFVFIPDLFHSLYQSMGVNSGQLETFMFAAEKYSILSYFSLLFFMLLKTFFYSLMVQLFFLLSGKDTSLSRNFYLLGWVHLISIFETMVRNINLFHMDKAEITRHHLMDMPLSLQAFFPHPDLAVNVWTMLGKANIFVLIQIILLAFLLARSYHFKITQTLAVSSGLRLLMYSLQWSIYHILYLLN